MDSKLKHISEILRQLNDELKLDNDKWEQANGRSNVLPTGDARIGNARTGNQTTGDDK